MLLHTKKKKKINTGLLLHHNFYCDSAVWLRCLRTESPRPITLSSARPIFKSSQTNLKKQTNKQTNKTKQSKKKTKAKQNKKKTKTKTKKKTGVRQTRSILYHRPKKGFFLRVRTWPTCMCPLALQELARPTCALALPKLHGAIPGAQLG